MVAQGLTRKPGVGGQVVVEIGSATLAADSLTIAVEPEELTLILPDPALIVVDSADDFGVVSDPDPTVTIAPD